MKNISQIKLFVSSPSDVMKERDAISEIINQINENEGLKDSFNINVYRWEKKYTPSFGPPQEVINKELQDTDIFVGILWNRFGTPTNNFNSGTEEEFETIFELYKKEKKIEICFYKCEKSGGYNKNNEEDLQQRKEVIAFFKKNNSIFGRGSYKKMEDFKINFRNDILTKIKSILDRNIKNEAITKHNNNCIINIYTSEDNELRNQDKINFLKYEEGDICLLAHSGNSYLHASNDATYGLFFNYIKERLLTKPYKIKILLLNPYSLEARKIFFAEKYNIYQYSISDIKNEQLEQGINFLRFQKCLQGIEKLMEEVDNNLLEVRITNTATDGTILLSGKRLFYEPYIISRFLKRTEKGMNSFELQIKNLLDIQCTSIYNQQLCMKCVDRNICKNNLYKSFAEHFYLLWSTSIALIEYNQNTKKYISDFNEFQPHLFYNQITHLHDSWYAFDPIIGCDGNCAYCFLAPFGWKNTTPQFRNQPNEKKSIYLKNTYDRELINNKYMYSNDSKRKYIGTVPISIGNNTDMFSNKNEPYLKYIIRLLKKRQNTRPIVFITKREIDLNIIDILKKLSFDVIILFSISFLSNEYEPNVPSYEIRLDSAKKVKEKIKNEGIKNIHIVHYWRPIIKLAKLSIEDIFIKIKETFDCSICIGLVINEDIYNYIKYNNQKLYNYLSSHINDEDIKNGKIKNILEPSYKEIQEIANKYFYPVFQHTSCALSYIQKKADFCGSMWREDFCNRCIQEQKDRCDSFKHNWSMDDYISFLDEKVKPNNYIFKEDCIKIKTLITQEKINYLTHIIGKPVYSDSVQLTLVWPSSNQIYFKTKYSQVDNNIFDQIKHEYPILTKQLERLKGITGFISILGIDNRVIIFNRYDHVKRVVRLLEWYIKDLEDLDVKKCAFLGLYHDINRLPFSHNLEKAIGFSQADTMRNYMSIFNTIIDDTYYKDFEAFYKKDILGSKESRIVLLIDSVAGFIEDSLFALTFLNIEITENILLILGFNNEELLSRNITKMRELFNKDINSFINEFNNISFEYSMTFINKYKKDKYKIFNDQEFINIRNILKNDLLIKKIFPINNEIISKGSKLYSEIGKPYINLLKQNNQDVYETLFKQTDEDLLKDAISKGIIKNENEYFPCLDVLVKNLEASSK